MTTFYIRNTPPVALKGQTTHYSPNPYSTQEAMRSHSAVHLDDILRTIKPPAVAQRNPLDPDM